MENVRLKSGEVVNIDTPEGAKAYLIDEGYDYDKLIDEGLKVLADINKKLNEETDP